MRWTQAGGGPHQVRGVSSCAAAASTASVPVSTTGWFLVMVATPDAARRRTSTKLRILEPWREQDKSWSTLRGFHLT